MNREQLLENAIEAAILGGLAIMEIYESTYTIEQKEDKTPLTQADKNAHEVIAKKLAQSELPILSEEGKLIPFETRKNWNQFWMVDPLDGTREFIKRNGEFTVNIALIENGETNMGIIYVPVTKVLYFADKTIGAYKITTTQQSNFKLNDLISQSKKLPQQVSRNKYIVVGSRSHMSSETEEYMNELKEIHQEIEMISIGSSLKLCMVADGTADSYPRFAPTMEWDTAAGQAIAIASGAEVLNWETKQRMKYNKENLLNSWFLVERK